ncbi:hypothetical protein [Streptomyces sp. NPDC005096]|uniref:hypothetical protein n=1 Tax=Streptomyces sp. NPDC005096 TaxID=3154559 RepID=UPI0033A0D6DD
MGMVRARISWITRVRSGCPSAGVHGLQRRGAGDADVAGDGWSDVLDDEQDRPAAEIGLDVDDHVRLVLLPVNAFREGELFGRRSAGDVSLPDGDDGRHDGDDDCPVVGVEGLEVIHGLTLPRGQPAGRG